MTINSNTNLSSETPYFIGKYNLYVLDESRNLINESPYTFLAYANVINDTIVLEVEKASISDFERLPLNKQLMKIKVSSLEDIFNEDIPYYQPNYDSYLEMYYSFQEKKVAQTLEIEAKFNEKIEKIKETIFFSNTKLEKDFLEVNLKNENNYKSK